MSIDSKPFSTKIEKNNGMPIYYLKIKELFCNSIYQLDYIDGLWE